MPSPHDPVAFAIFGLTIRWYALILLSAIVVGITLIAQLAKRRGMDPDFFLDIAPWVVLSAIVGARVYYILLRGGYFLDHPGEAVNVRLGGLTIHGALAAGIGVFYLFYRRRGQPFLAWADLAMAVVPIGQAIGRLGNWANQEAFGRPSTLPWAVEIDPERRPAEYAAFATFHPTFLYEGLLDLGIAAVLISLVLRMPRDRRLRPGDALWTYLLLYGLARLAIEPLRTDSLYIGPLPAAYWLSGALIVLGGAMLLIRHVGYDARRDVPATVAVGEAERDDF